MFQHQEWWIYFNYISLWIKIIWFILKELLRLLINRMNKDLEFHTLMSLVALENLANCQILQKTGLLLIELIPLILSTEILQFGTVHLAYLL